MMRSYITLNGLRFYAYHGVLPQERNVGGDYILSLRLGYDISRAMQSDDVSDTLNYAEVYQLVPYRQCDKGKLPSRHIHRLDAEQGEPSHGCRQHGGWCGTSCR